VAALKKETCDLNNSQKVNSQKVNAAAVKNSAGVDKSGRIWYNKRKSKKEKKP
jgi:hypothetical protein